NPAGFADAPAGSRRRVDVADRREAGIAERRLASELAERAGKGNNRAHGPPQRPRRPRQARRLEPYRRGTNRGSDSRHLLLLRQPSYKRPVLTTCWASPEDARGGRDVLQTIGA